MAESARSRCGYEGLLRQRSALPDEVLAEALGNLGYSRCRSGDLDAAVALLHESIEISRLLGNRSMAAWATSKYALALFARGEYTVALELAELALADFRDLDNQEAVADTLNFTGSVLFRLGDLDRAREAFDHALATAEATGDYAADVLHSLADLELQQRDLGKAEAHYVRARDIAREFKDWFDVACCLAGLACVAALRGDAEAAGEHWGRVERIDAPLFAWDRDRYEHILEPLRKDPAFRSGYDAGRAAPIDSLSPLR